MIVSNRVAEYYRNQKLVPFDEVEELRCDSWNEGYRSGFSNGNSAWIVGMFLGFFVGCLFAAVVL